MIEAGIKCLRACPGQIGPLPDHIENARRHLRFQEIRGAGNIRVALGTAISDWHAVGAEGKILMGGTDVIVLGPDGLITDITGLPAGSES